MKVLELFCGSKSFANIAKARGHETFTIDIEPRFEPDMVADIGKLQVSDLPQDWRHPDVVWASPPCEKFSIAAMHCHYWEKHGAVYRGNPQAEEALNLVEHTMKLIKELRSTWWFVENPVGFLRVQSCMKGKKRRTVTYCRYGHQCRKPTDIWTNYYGWIPRKACRNGDPCHKSSPSSTNRGIRDMASTAIERAIIPPALCEEIIIACERGMSQNKQDHDKESE